VHLVPVIARDMGRVMPALNAQLNTEPAKNIGLMAMRFTPLAVIETVCFQPTKPFATAKALTVT